MLVTLVRGSGYVLPLSKKTVRPNEIVEINDAEWQKVKLSKRFRVLPEDTQPAADGLAGLGLVVGSIKEPDKHLPKDWSGKSICVKCCGGVGDAVIAHSVITSLKSKDCYVAAAVRDQYVDFFQKFVASDETIAGSQTNDLKVRERFDIMLDASYTLTTREGHSREGKLEETNYYRAMHDKLGINEKVRLPQVEFDRRQLAKLRESMPENRPIVALHAGASNPIRRWLNDYWTRLAYMLRDAGCQVIFMGAGDDFSFDDKGILSAEGISHGLHDQMAMLHMCDYFIGNDSCFAHFAGILSKPGIVLFFASTPEAVISEYPLLKEYHMFDELNVVPSRQLKNDDVNAVACMKCMTPERVFAQIDRRLLETADKNVADRGVKEEVLMPRMQPVNKTRLLVVGPVFGQFGGGEIATASLLKELGKWFDITTFSLEEQAGKGLLSVKQLEKELPEHDVLLWYAWGQPVQAAIQRLPHSCLRIRWCHTEQEAEVFRLRAGAKYEDACVVVSPNIANAEHGENIFWIPNGVDESRFPETVERAQISFANDDPIVGYIGRMDSQKHPRWLIENCEKIGINLVLVGCSPRDIDTMKQWAKQTDTTDRIRLFARTTDVAKFYDALDLSVLVSDYEGMPLQPLEAAYMGVPSICTRVGCLEKVFTDREDILFTERTVESMQKAIADWKENPTIGPNAKKLVSENYVVSKQAETFRKLIHRLMGETWPEEVRKGEILIRRKFGAGDVIMTSSLRRKVREMFPDANIAFETTEVFEQFVELDPHVDEIIHSKRRADLVCNCSYYDCWKGQKQHAADAIGGGQDLDLYLPDEVIERVRGELGLLTLEKTVGIWPYQNNQSIYMVKQWPNEFWEELCNRLHDEGIETVQLGAVFEERLPFIKHDFRQGPIVDSLASLACVDLVVCIDCVAQHACKAMDQPCVVLWGGSNEPWLTGYSDQTNLKTSDSFSCWASVCASTYRSESCCKEAGRCMRGLSVDTVKDAILNHGRIKR